MAEVVDGQAGKELTRAQRVALWAGRALFFLPVTVFVVAWAWYFITVLSRGQYSWAFWSLLLFSLFLFATAISPRRHASKLELGLAAARLVVEYGAPRGAEDVIEKVKAAIPEEARKAVEKARPQLVEEVRRDLTSLSEKAARAALSTSTVPATGLPLGGALTWPNLTFRPSDDPATKALISILSGISDGDRVLMGGKLGTVRKVMSDGRSRVEWSDGTSTVEDSAKLMKM